MIRIVSLVIIKHPLSRSVHLLRALFVSTFVRTSFVSTLVRTLITGISLIILSSETFAQDINITTASDLNKALNMAKSGDTLILQSGIYKGHFNVTKSISLHCLSDVTLDGEGKHNTLTLSAANIQIRHCHIVNWGNDLTEMNAGIYVTSKADNVLIEDNQLKGDAFGILLDDTTGAKVYRNQIEGNLSIRSQDRGNGIHIYNNRKADIAFNHIWHTRDGIYIETSNGNQLRHNEMHDLRYGIHYMYSYSNLIEENYTHNTRTGYALMQSKFLKVLNNLSDGDQNYGILLNFVTHSTFSGNHLINVQQGMDPGAQRLIQGAEGKGLFVYNSLYNEFSNNFIENSGIGIHLTAGSEDNTFFANQFINNQRQVKYVSTRRQEWSHNGQGNFWSDYMGWDRDDNDIGDTWYEPNDNIDRLLWKYPSARLLMNSPAIQLLKMIQSEFPVLRSPGIRDSYPLMTPSTNTVSAVVTRR